MDRKPTGGWWVRCWACPGRGEYLALLAEALDLPPGSGGLLLDDPLTYLGDPQAARATDREPAPLPSERQIARWQRALERSRAARLYVTHARGLDWTTIDRHQLGYDGSAVTLPVRDADGRLVNLRRRFLDPGAGPKMVGLGGRGSQLYPTPPQRRRVVLCAGEFDALIARQHGIHAVTTTCGASLPGALVAALRPAGRGIAVVYDAGEQDQAAATARKLRAAGAQVRVVRLPLPHGGDLTDWFRAGRTAAELRRLLRWSGAVAT
ncbi:hypothetical protein [Miltoncostaea marina]|uniref:hypothetical protein n=1 Tax=Miltoncostaea marina TaxID=2843215 RepID=UPI001C3D400D|nr:hypothetical protein [Miltoncostaea marina]